MIWESLALYRIFRCIFYYKKFSLLWRFFFIFMREILPILIVLILKIFRRFMISDNDFFFYQKFQVLTWKWYSSLISKKLISDILNSICWYQKVMLDIRNWNWFFFKTNYLSEIQKILEFTRHNQKIQMIFYSKQWFFFSSENHYW